MHHKDGKTKGCVGQGGAGWGMSCGVELNAHRVSCKKASSDRRESPSNAWEAGKYDAETPIDATLGLLTNGPDSLFVLNEPKRMTAREPSTSLL